MKYTEFGTCLICCKKPCQCKKQCQCQCRAEFIKELPNYLYEYGIEMGSAKPLEDLTAKEMFDLVAASAPLIKKNKSPQP